MSAYVDELMAQVKAKNPAQPEFHQAVQEVAESLDLVFERHPEYRSAKVLERIADRALRQVQRNRRVRQARVLNDLGRVYSAQDESVISIQRDRLRDYDLKGFRGTVHEDGVQALIDTAMALGKMQFEVRTWVRTCGSRTSGWSKPPLPTMPWTAPG